MRLFAALFGRHGIDARIAAPRELVSDGGVVTHRGDRIDLTYNRLTDFDVESESAAAVREAWATGKTVVTPPPRAYARLADKRNLAILSDPERLRAFGVSQDAIDGLARVVPTTRRVRRRRRRYAVGRPQAAVLQAGDGLGHIHERPGRPRLRATGCVGPMARELQRPHDMSNNQPNTSRKQPDQAREEKEKEGLDKGKSREDSTPGQPKSKPAGDDRGRSPRR